MSGRRPLIIRFIFHFTCAACAFGSRRVSAHYYDDSIRFMMSLRKASLTFSKSALS